jgi:hypothetical protein
MATWTQALVAAIAEGVLEVNYGDKKVIYRSLNEMLKLKAIMETDLGTRKAGSGRKFGTFDKGLI